ncbi:Imm52 family immunity protein [Rahnella laticis]|uniref:Imm52 family immunity protein n=1 Tax=Rahnella laticis TaxID=2787622 RepID=UPI0018A2AE13|nr:Imm52 family immunity protein [Rahnella laticis]MBF7997674.1 immunity 52 family protein [Rahnella laticis]
MQTRFVVNFDFRTKNDEIQFSEIINHFNFIIAQIDEFSKNKRDWYETGYSRKQALSQLAFRNGDILDNTRSKWERRYKKNNPLFVDGVWDANDDAHCCGISYRKMYYAEKNRASVEFTLVPDDEGDILSRFIVLISKLASFFVCSYVNIDSKGYSVLGRNVFPDRLHAGWMLFIPHTVLPELIPEAAKVVPVVDNGRQKGTIIVSTEDVFDGDNPVHIAKANDIEIRLLDLGFLPLMADL